jgi:hypothetical protein
LSWTSDDDHDDQALLRFHKLDGVLRPTTVPGQVERVFHEELHAVSAEEPTSLEEAAHDPSWRAAMMEELCSIEDNKTWDIVDLSTGHQAIGLKWVYKAKKDEHGHVIKHKARLVACGFV